MVAREPHLGLQTGFPSDLVVSLAIQAGFDYLWLDAEHTTLSAERAATYVATARPAGLEVLVRVSNVDFDNLVTFANTGADEIIIPQVREPAEVDRAWQALHYAPHGLRPRQIVPASGYGESWSTTPRLSVIIETADAVDHLDELISNDHIDGFWIGHKDLRDDYLRLESTESVDLVTDDLVSRLRRAGREFGLAADGPSAIANAFGAGANRCSVYLELYLRRCLADLVAGRGPG